METTYTATELIVKSQILLAYFKVVCLHSRTYKQNQNCTVALCSASGIANKTNTHFDVTFLLNILCIWYVIRIDLTIWFVCVHTNVTHSVHM